MKKALVVVLALVMALSVVGLVSCAGKTYEGEYHYVMNYGTEVHYGCKVRVTVQGNVITNVEMLSDSETGWHNLSPNWTNNYQGGPIEGEAGVDTEGKTNWRKYGQAMVDSFVGLTKEEVLGMKVYVTPAGEPLTGNSKVETVKYIPDQLAVVIGGHGDFAKDAGATQSTARLILAVQDALLEAKGDTSKNSNCVTLDLGQTVEGTYSYANTHGSGFYGVTVEVTVKNGKISDVIVNPDTEDMTNLTAVWTENYQPDGTPTAGKQNWIDHGADMAKSFVGLSVEDVMAITVACAESGEPNTGTADNPINPFTNIPEGLIVIQGGVGDIAAKAGATQSSGRLILAVQNALSKLA